MIQTTLKKNRILQMQNQIPSGMQCFTGDPILIEIMGLTGFDCVMFDSEHRTREELKGVKNIVR